MNTLIPAQRFGRVMVDRFEQSITSICVHVSEIETHMVRIYRPNATVRRYIHKKSDEWTQDVTDALVRDWYMGRVQRFGRVMVNRFEHQHEELRHIQVSRPCVCIFNYTRGVYLPKSATLQRWTHTQSTRWTHFD